MTFAPSAARRSQAAKSRVGFVVSFVRLDDIEDLDAKIRQLNSEWELQFNLINPAQKETWFRWRFDFVPWRAVWSGWVSTHVSLFERSGDQVVGDFQEFEAQYNELRRRFVDDLQATTGTKKQKTGSAGTTTVVSDALGEIGGIVKIGLFAYFALLIFKEVKRSKKK